MADVTQANNIAQANKPITLLAILAVALLLRIGAALYLGNTVSGLSGANDEITYSMLGHRFATGHGMTFPEPWYPWIAADAPQSYFSYTFSLFIAGIYKLFGFYPLAARLVMALLSTAIVGMVYLLGRRLFSETVALLAAGIAAIYAYLIFYGAALVTETPFTLALMITLYVAVRIRERELQGIWAWCLLGVILAIAVLSRVAVIFFVPILLLWLYWSLRQEIKLPMLFIPLVMIGLALLPLTSRNYQLWGEFALSEAQFGHVFWNGNHPGHMGNFHPFKVFPIPEDVLTLNNDVLITNTLLHMAVANILADPWNFVMLTITRLRELFVFWPTSDSTLQANLLRVFSFGLIVPFALYGIAANLRRFGELAPIYLFFIIHVGVYAVTWTMVRYRVPLDPFFILFAAHTLTRFYGTLRGRRPAMLAPHQQAASN
ncbi:MAG TPA: glycosyltransferase family 39 protein [Caldilineaceae bacterium]|nr:glycosyltransferase family 39 protein [Caldilineaceae bacterium]